MKNLQRRKNLEERSLQGIDNTSFEIEKNKGKHHQYFVKLQNHLLIFLLWRDAVPGYYWEFLYLPQICVTKVLSDFSLMLLIFICLKTQTKGDPSSYFCFAVGYIMCSLNETKFKQNFLTRGLGKLQELFDRKK